MGSDLDRHRLSKRGRLPVEGQALPPYLEAHFERLDQLYDSAQNPSGYIPLCIAENRLVWDLIEPRVNRDRGVPATAFGYDHMVGSVDFREKLADFAEHHFLGRRFETDDIAVLAGAGSVLETLFYSIADPGDGVLVPTPSYAGFWLDLETRNQLKIVEAHTQAANGFKLTTDLLDQALAGADRPVRALLFTNPNNPLGTVSTPEEILAVVEWALANEIHIVVDEIYALSVFGEPPFTSVASLIPSLGELVHIVWAFSKDMAASGLRCGTLFSENQGVLAAVNALAYWSACSGDTQHLLGQLISDTEWTDTYIAGMRERLRGAYQAVAARLDHYQIPYWPADAGFFLLVDVRGLMNEPTWAAEGRLWRQWLEQANVNLTPGCSLHNAEPGFMRLCFAGVATEAVVTAIDRIAGLAGLTGAG